MTHKLHLLPAVIATGLLSFSGVLIETAMNVTFPILIDQFNINPSTVQWVTTMYLLVIAIMVPLTNFLLKRFALKPLFIIANLLFILGLSLDLLASNFVMLLIGRFFQGFGTGIGLPLMFHIILTFAPLAKRGLMMGIGTLTTSIAPAIGPTYGGLLTTNYSWHYIFLFLIPILIISLVIGIYAIPYIKPNSTSSLDTIHLVSLAIFFTGMLIFLNEPTKLANIGLCFLGLVAGGFSIYRAKTSPYPLLRLHVITNRPYRTFLLSFLAIQALFLGGSFVIPTFIQVSLGYNAFIAGAAMIPGALISALLAPIAGRLLDQVGPQKPIIGGLSIACLGLLILIVSFWQHTILFLIIGHAIYSIGTGLAYSNLMTAGMNTLSSKEYGDGSTIFNTLQQFIGAVATTVVATIMTIAQASQSNQIIGTNLGAIIGLVFLFILLFIALLSCINYFKRYHVLTN
ncbi:MFS transporter [Periweissella fabalis]|uniref:Multidrug efflux MFS transporter n=1 Tax=Periweissella fabalis TaxID=1070421 RepID=A0A7X6MZY1_9LACO|nr:MFS transporter [Periweissella fabalis]MCM0598983.1 MFS transporter [Periweissella fabalis]NKZ23263.1 multidrug efflux MFS transporter [Periweissella fabalis]